MRSLSLLATVAIRHQQRLFNTSSRVLAGDPVQDVFVKMIRDYKQKSAGGKLVDSSPQVEKALNDALAQVAAAFKVDDPKKAYEFPAVDLGGKDAKIAPIVQMKVPALEMSVEPPLKVIRDYP